MTTFIRLDFESQEELESFLEDLDQDDYPFFSFFNPKECWVPSEELEDVRDDLNTDPDDWEQPFALFEVRDDQRDHLVFHLGALKVHHEFTMEWSA